MLVLLMSSTKAQTDNPILPRIHEDGYTLEQIEDFALEANEFSQNYRKKLLSIINSALRSSGEYVNVNNGKPLTENHISWIYDQVQRDLKGYLPAGYSNTYRNGNSVKPTTGKIDYFGPIDRFVFGSCVVNLDKPSCVNLLGDMGIFEPPFRANQITQQDPTLQKSEQQIVASQPEQTSITGFVQPKTVSEMMMTKVPEEASPKLFIPTEESTWINRNGSWFWPVTAGLITFGTGFIAHDKDHQWYFLFPKDQPPPPVVFVPVDTNGGTVGP